MNIKLLMNNESYYIKIQKRRGNQGQKMNMKLEDREEIETGLKSRK